jgi:Flp pilus assembly protein TadD, contains TPR repeats
MSSPLDSVVFITIPEAHRLASSFPGFDPSIPLPVQLPAPDAQLDAAGLTSEMVLAGILAVLAWDPDNGQLDYYRSIIHSVHPALRQEMTDAAILKIRNGDFELAEEIFRALRGLDPSDMMTVLNLALLMDERGDNMRRSGLDDDADALDAEAFNLYRIAMTAEPPMPEAFFNAGFFYLKQKNFRKAREVLETYLKLETGEDETAQVRKEKAREITGEIAGRDLDDDLFMSAFELINLGQEEKALEQIRLFMEHHPKVWNAWFLLGWALRRLERWEDAKAAFVQALELGKQPGQGIESGYTDICNELAICLMELGDYEKSRQSLIAALEQESENTKVIANLGMLALRQGNQEEAAGFFRTVLEIDPNDQLAREMLARAEKRAD